MKELNKLDIKLGEWAGVVHFGLKFTANLNACFEWLVPKLHGLGWGAVVFQEGELFYCGLKPTDRLELKFNRGMYAETPALALCRVVEKLIDDERTKPSL